MRWVTPHTHAYIKNRGGRPLWKLTQHGRNKRIAQQRHKRTHRAREGKTSATVNGSNFATERTKATKTTNCTTDTDKSQQKRKFKAWEHNERQSNTANARSTRYNAPRIAQNARTAHKAHQCTNESTKGNRAHLWGYQRTHCKSCTFFVWFLQYRAIFAMYHHALKCKKKRENERKTEKKRAFKSFCE